MSPNRRIEERPHEDGFRHAPSQHRSRAIVAAIVEAARRLLAEGAGSRLTTAKIAERAGVSIGSFYRYFPNLEAVVSAVQRSEAAAEAADLGQVAWPIESLPLHEAIASLVDFQLERHRRLIGTFGRHHQERHRNTSLAQAYGAREVEQRILALLHRHAAALSVRDLEQAAFLLSRGISAIVRTTVEERPEKLEEPAFREALVEMVTRYLCLDPGGA